MSKDSNEKPTNSPRKLTPSHPPSTTITNTSSLPDPEFSSPPFSYHNLSPPKKSFTQRTEPHRRISKGRAYPGGRPLLGEYQPPAKPEIEQLQDLNEAKRGQPPRCLWRGVLYKIRKGRGGGENYIDNELPREKAGCNVSDEGEGGKKK